jgi:hypothetical protein
MPSAPARNTTFPNLSHVKSDDQSFPSSSPQVITRMLHSQKPRGTGQNGISSNLDEVTFLRLPGVKAITGLSKSSLYADSREELSRACSAWSARSSVGKIRGQAVGLRACTCVTIGRMMSLTTLFLVLAFVGIAEWLRLTPPMLSCP